MKLPNWRDLKYDLEYWWDHFEPRRWANDHPRQVTWIAGGSVTLLLLVLLLLLVGHARKPKPNRAWFYDLDTRQLFVAMEDDAPPIMAPSQDKHAVQPRGVRAYVFTHDPAAPKPKTFIGYLETFNEDAQDARAALDDADSQQRSPLIQRINRGRQVKCLTDQTWSSVQSPQGQRIIQEPMLQRENDQRPQVHRPGKND